ncbi:MAG TPA: hypothetical protein VE172_17875, partial [Stackebrandtia sp.]|uniref:hypothetical protein n=1 Tax=Stackebrandtia sp. TaxID=2023065 RepID=UPI002D47912C
LVSAAGVSRPVSMTIVRVGPSAIRWTVMHAPASRLYYRTWNSSWKRVFRCASVLLAGPVETGVTRAVEP